MNRPRLPTIRMRNIKFFVKGLLILMVIIMLSGCSPNSVPRADRIGKVDSAVIVVPGYYGTRLVRESDGSLVFITLSQVLFGDQSLTIPVPGLGFEGAINLQPDGIFDAFGVVPLFYSIDVYGSLLDRLRLANHTSRDVIPFSYDWRGDLMEAVHRLDGLIRRLRDEGKNDISIVAHSMGGLIVSYYMRYGTQDIESAVENWKGADHLQRVVLAGVPFRGVMNSFRNMNFGVKVGWNSSLLSAEAYASFPASYYTLPVADSDELLTPDLKPVSGVIRNAGQWERSEWGLLRDRKTLPMEIVERRATYTSFWLDRSQRFLDLIRAPFSTASSHQPTLFYMYAKGTPTLANGVWVENPAPGRNSLLFDDPVPVESRFEKDIPNLYGDGDGTVTVSSAMIPHAFGRAFPTTIREYKVGHTDLVSNPGNQQDILTFLDNR